MISSDKVSRIKKSAKASSTPVDASVRPLLARIGEGKRLLRPRAGTKLFTQGDRADSIFFLDSGRVKMTVVSAGGKEAVIAISGPDTFIGEGALIGQSVRIGTATVLEPSRILQIDRLAMGRALHEHRGLSEKFIAALLTRNIDLEADLCDQLFNHSEKRLARVLLKLARLHEHTDVPNAAIPRVTHETLAEMVGTTRARVTQFMNKFRAMGLIDYNGELTVRTELLVDVVLHD
jgi:CRP/FNR family transcriptional regulator, cyclic AMP receptor protein